MKQGWEEIQLGDLCEFRNGLWKGKKPPFVTSKVIRMTNFTKECEMNTIEPIELEVEEKQFSSRSLIDGDLLLEKSGGSPKQPVGRVVRFEAPDNGNYSFSNFTTRIRISKLDKIDSKYLHKYLKFFYLIGKTEPLQSNSTNIRNLQLPAFKKIPIPIPPLEEQKQIVAKLDQCFEAIDKAKANAAKNLENAKELFQSKLNDIFSQKGENWTEKSLVDICDEILAGGDAPNDNYSKDKTQEYTIPIYANAVKNNGLYGYTNLSRVSKPSVTIAARGSGTGHTEIRIEPFYPIVRLIVLIPNDEVINLYFLKYSIQTLDILRSGSAIPQLTVPMIKEYLIPVPPLSQQVKAVQLLDKLKEQTQSLESKYQQELNSLEGLKKSILEKAFEGEL